jgi:long-chain acyl-CoA synthetase
MTLASAFASSARRHRDKTAVFSGEAEHTYGQILSAAERVAWRLQNEHGVKQGDRVGVWLKNCPEYIPALFGIWLAGGVAVPINSFLKPDEVSYILGDAAIRVLFAEPSHAAGLTAHGARPAFVFLEPLGEEAEGRAPAVPSAADSLAMIIYTSGTTGHPKGAMLSHSNLLHNVESCRQVLSAVDHDRFVLLLPMFHSFMLTVCVLLPLMVGGSLVLIKSLHPPKNVLTEIMRHGATILPAIPPLFRSLAQLPGVPAEFPLRLCISGAAPLPAQVTREFNQRFPIPLLEGYGLSEASPVVSMMPLAGPFKAGSIGVPVPNVEMSIQDEAGRGLAVGDTGEICVRGGNVMRGYWNRPAETQAVLRDGWLLTGDVGHRDADGYYYITDRKKDMLLVNGMNVYPREIEEVAYGFPGVKEVAVVSRQDPRKGEQPVAFIAAQEGTIVDESALLEFLRARLADYKVPRRIHLVAMLPRNATGKVLKTRLRQMSADL